MIANDINCESSAGTEVASCLDSFVSEVVDGLTETEMSSEQVESIAAEGEAVISTVTECVDELATETDRLGQDMQNRGASDAEDRKRIRELEDALDRQTDDTEAVEPDSPDTAPTPDPDKTTPQSSLEQVVALPESVADGELSSNQQRARFVAQDVAQYASKAPAGFVLSSGDIATVLRAGTDCKGHTETVTRVMEFLDDLGGGGVKIVKRRGTRRIVFKPAVVDRLTELASKSHRGDGARETQPLVV